MNDDRSPKVRHRVFQSRNILARFVESCVTAAIVLILLSVRGEAEPSQNRFESIPAAPKVLMFSAIDVWYAADTIAQWGQRGINGFMLSYIAYWFSLPSDLEASRPYVTLLNERGAPHGVDSNFITVALGYKSLRGGSEPPVWTDDQGWTQVLETFASIAKFIRSTGTRGIALDTEYYGVELWDPESERFNQTPKSILRAKVFQRGRELMQVLVNEFPDIEVILLQEGAYWWFKEWYRLPQYEMWIDFYDGLASVHNNRGIIVGVENTYSRTDPTVLTTWHRDNYDIMLSRSADSAFWKEKGSLAIGMWPLGIAYENKTANYSAQQFRKQFQAAQSLCPRYIWIYDHGVAWMQLTEEQVTRYSSHGRYVFCPSCQVLPTDPDIEDYFSIVNQRGSLH